MTGYTQNTADTKQSQQQLERASRGNFSYFAQLTFVVITFESVEMSFYLWKCVICNRPSIQTKTLFQNQRVLIIILIFPLHQSQSSNLIKIVLSTFSYINTAKT